MAEGAIAITAATPGADGARHALRLAWLATPITNPRKYCVTRSLDGDGNHIGWLVRQGGDKGQVLHSFARGDAQLTDCVLTWALLRAKAPEGFIEKDELGVLYWLGPQHGHRILSGLDQAGAPVRPGLAGCQAKGWVTGTSPVRNLTHAWYRLSEEGERVASKFFPQGYRTWL